MMVNYMDRGVVFSVTVALCLVWCSRSCAEDIRLVNGAINTTEAHGILEIFRNGSWKIVCSLQFSDTDANLVCQHLGYRAGQALPQAAYGPYFGNYTEQFIECQGDSGLDFQCQFDSVRLETCLKEAVYYASVYCYNDTKVKPEKTTKIAEDFHGSVMFYSQGYWGQICAEYWGKNDAKVLCRSHGFQNGIAMVTASLPFVPYTLTGVECTGSEASLENCIVERQICEDTSVQAATLCYNTDVSVGLVRSPQNPRVGRVVIKYDGEEGGICGSDSDHSNNARVICQQLGYHTGIVLDKSSPLWTSGNGMYFLSNVNCTGTEDSVLMCKNEGWNTTINSCNTTEMDLNVVCFESVYLLFGSKDENRQLIMGQVAIYQDNSPTTLCADSFTGNSAQVLCGLLGYGNSKILLPHNFGSAAYSSFTTNLKCTGNEKNIHDCTFEIGYCRYRETASLLCYNGTLLLEFSVKLSDNYHGTVLVNMFGVNGTICRNGWGNKEAKILCKSLGYNDGMELGTSIYSEKKPVWFTKFECAGNETSLTSCKYEIDYSSTCMRDTSPAGAICFNSQSDIDIQLADGRNPKSEGRVEIDFKNEVGTVCDNSWSASDAKVVCQGLGFAFGKPLLNSHFGNGKGPIYLDNLRCDGSEESILACPNTGWNLTSSSCISHENDASVQCEPIAKLGITTYYGPVLMYNDTHSTYGLVCDDGFFDHQAAKVICKEYDFSFSQIVCCSAFGSTDTVGGYPLLFSKMSCHGNESRLVDCAYQTGIGSCISGQYVSVVCANEDELPSAPSAQITIHSSQTNSYSGGYLEVYHFAMFGYICTENFDDLDATVICKSKKQMTFGLAYKHFTQSTLSDRNMFGSKFYWVKDVKCSGNEPSLAYCPGLSWGQAYNCSHEAIAGIFCSNQKVGFNVSLQNKTSMMGRIHISIDGLIGHSGSICGSNFTRAEASVICKDLNLRDGVALKAGSFGNNDVSGIFIEDMKCPSGAKSLKDCFLKIDSGNCDTGPAAVQCYSDVRLSGSEYSWYGRLEIHDGSKWQAVCDDNFGSEEAEVACKYLGFVTGKKQCCSALGPLPSSTNIGYSEFECSGTETHPLQCKHSTQTCSSNGYITLLCLSDPNASEDISFSLPLDSYYGPLLMKRYGILGYVCDSEWRDIEADFHCRKLGFNFGRAVHTYRNDYLPITGKVKCSQFDNPDAGLCSTSSFESVGNCYGIGTVAGMICSNTQGNITFRQELTPNVKVAYISVDTKQMLIEHFNKDAAGVFCRSMKMKFVDGSAETKYSNTAAVLNIKCTGKEDNFLQCKGLWDPREAKRTDLVSVRCHYKVRLLGDGLYYGPIEVYSDNKWVQVCGDWITNADADVVCKTLGYDAGVPICCSAFGALSQNAPGYESLSCTGAEDDVSQCGLQPLASISCPRLHASVVCYTNPKDQTYQIHLENNIGSGEVKLTYLNVKGRICADDWGNNDAKVICKELGYVDGISYKHFSDSEAQGPYWTSNVECDAQNDNRLVDCTHVGFGQVQTCKSIHSAGVICFNEFGVYYRIAGGTNTQYGRLEVFLGKEWGTICNKYWGLTEAHVTCKQFGYNTGDPFLGPYSLPPPRLTYGTRLQCTGQESTLNSCPHNGWALASDQNCQAHKNDVGVFCYKNVKLHSGIGRTNNSGALLLYHQGQWNLVCDEEISNLEATRACQELGWKFGKSECCSKYGSLSYKFDGNLTLSCSQDSQDVSECVATVTCKSMNYVSIICSDERFPTTIVPSSTTIRTTDALPANQTPVIIGVAVAASIIIIVLLVILIVKCRNSNKRFEKFSSPVQHQVSYDGSVSLENPLHNVSGLEDEGNNYQALSPARHEHHNNGNNREQMTPSGYFQISDVSRKTDTNERQIPGRSVSEQNGQLEQQDNDDDFFHQYDGLKQRKSISGYDNHIYEKDQWEQGEEKMPDPLSEETEPSQPTLGLNQTDSQDQFQRTQRDSLASCAEIQSPSSFKLNHKIPDKTSVENSLN